DPDPLADQDLGVPTADPTEIEEAVFVDMGHHQADLVDVTREHDPRRAAGVERRAGVATDTDRDLVREPLRLGTPDPRRRRLEAARPRGVQQLLQKIDRLHLIPLSVLSCRRRRRALLYSRPPIPRVPLQDTRGSRPRNGDPRLAL